MPLQFAIQATDTPATPQRLQEVHAAPGFGQVFTDHMVTARWTPEAGWREALVRPYGPLTLDPATQIFHYGQSIFEGFKAYTQSDGSIATFRPESNGERFQHSARRLALPELPVEDFVTATDLLIRQDAAWVPTGGETSLYVRPFMMATEVGLGVRPARDVLFIVVASPAGSYFAAGSSQLAVWVSEEYTRAAPGGTGAAKCGGNYAASLIAQQEAIDNGCEQALFLDAVERRWIEELGGMNLWFVLADGTLVTPVLTGTILEGITRDTMMNLARDHGHRVEERRVDIDEWRKGLDGDDITEVFACGTAAVITSIGTLRWHGGELSMPAETPVAQKLRSALIDVQLGRSADTHGWLHRVP
jgi:branched-chain amino acid aminotransferase